MLVDLNFFSFFGGSFGFEIFHTCNPKEDGLKSKIPWENKSFSILGGCQSWQL